VKIAYFFSVFPRLSTTFLQREVRAMQKLGIYPVLTANRPPISGDFHPFDQDLIKQTFYLTPIKPMRYLKSNFKLFYKSPRRYIKTILLALRLNDDFPWQRFKNLARVAGAAVLAEYFAKKEVVHVHVHFAFGAAGVAIFLETLTGIPYSLSIHGSDVLLPRPLTEEKIRRARFIISNCKFHIDNLKRRFLSVQNQRFHIVRLGVNVKSGIWSQSKPLKTGLPLRILNVARLEAVKAQDVLIKACAQLVRRNIPFHCRIVGDGTERKNLEALIRRFNLEHSVELMGSKYEPEVAKLFEWAQVMVLSSLSEGTPMTVIEAMAKTRPVIAPRITALPEMVTEGKTGFLFSKGTSSELADILFRLSENSELLEFLGENGRKEAENCFNLNHNVKRLTAVFNYELPELNLFK